MNSVHELAHDKRWASDKGLILLWFQKWFFSAMLALGRYAGKIRRALPIKKKEHETVRILAK
jgi:hypothetical protein